MAEDALRKEQFDARVAQQKQFLQQKQARRELTPEEAQLGARVLGIIVGIGILVYLLVSIGRVLSYPAFWIMLLACVAAAIAFRKRVQLNWKIIMVAGACFAVVLISVSQTQQARNHAALAAQNAARRAQVAREAHERRLAWNKAHPREAARRLEQQRAAAASVRHHQTEEQRIASIPYTTRLAHAKTEFDQLAGADGLFASAIILHTYIRDDRVVLMVDKAAWDGLSPFERDGYTSNVNKDWAKACSDNFACDSNDIHSQDGGNSLGYQFTSYFDSH